MQLAPRLSALVVALCLASRAPAQQSIHSSIVTGTVLNEITSKVYVDPQGVAYCVANSQGICCAWALLYAIAPGGGFLWSRIYSPNPDLVRNYASTRDPATGWISMTGQQLNTTTLVRDLFVCSYDSNGAFLWATTFAGPQGGWDTGYAITHDAQGDLYVAGTIDSDSTASPPSDIVVLKYSSTGQLLWTHTIGNAAGTADDARDLALDSEGNVIVLGQAGSGTLGWTIAAKLAPDGSELWKREWEISPAYEYVRFLRSTPDDRLVIGGEAVDAGQGCGVVQMLEADGTIAWTWFAHGPSGSNDMSFAMDLGPGGAPVLALRRSLPSTPYTVAHTLELDAQGALAWEHDFSGAASLEVFDVLAEGNGRVTLCCREMAPGPFHSTALSHVVQYEVDGAELWAYTLPDGVTCTSLARSPLGELLCAGDVLPAASGSLADSELLALDGQAHSFCAGDGSVASCPCANDSAPGQQRGCVDSTGVGALLLESGDARLQGDTLVLTSRGEPWSALTVFLQGTTPVNFLQFGDGLRCTGGPLKRLYLKHAVAGVARAPELGDLPVSQQSALLGDSLTAGDRRYLQAYFRDPSPTFCPAPQGNTWNISSGLVLDWLP